jgi:hypothetical protein
MSLTIVVGGEVEASHGGAPTMAEASAVLWRPQYVVVVAWRRGRCGEARKRIDKGRNVAVILPGACSWIDRPDAYDNNRHHSALSVIFAILATATRGAATAPLSSAAWLLGVAAKPEHPEEVERLLLASYTIVVLSALIVPQSRCYAAVLQRLQECVKRAVACRCRVVFADQGGRSGRGGEGQQA